MKGVRNLVDAAAECRLLDKALWESLGIREARSASRFWYDRYMKLRAKKQQTASETRTAET